jgi:peptidoglycan hydrolase-like protein with peptidoglycan-binding domain
MAVLAMTGLSGIAVAATTGGSVQASSASTTLHPGDRGAAVRTLQRKLGIAADGVYGRATKRAVRRFQARHHLAVDGVAGPATLRALGIRARAAAGSGGATFRSAPAPTSTQVPAALRRIAACESGGNPRAISRDGRYRGKYQFDLSTWQAIGGSGDPARASESEQDRRAIALYRKRGTAPWANCA